MNFSLVFQNSGDSIPFQTVSSQAAELLTYYVENLNNQNRNKFSSSAGSEIKNNINKLHSSIVECNKFVYELLDQYIDTYSIEEYLDQQNLNKLHADWVKSKTVVYNILKKQKQYNSQQSELIHSMFSDDIPETTVGTIISKLGFNKHHNDINLNIHRLESLFNSMMFSVEEWTSLPNPFSKSLSTNDICNFRLSFNHLGRHLYNKFVFFDHNLEFDDENSYNELLGFVDVKLAVPQTIPLSKEYVAWCNQHNKVPSGENLNIGNIPNLLENLTDYRKIVFRNTLQNNAFTIQL
jgi:hypothetical protein